MLTRAEVEELTKLSCTTVYRLVRSGAFPAPLKYAPGGAVRWVRAEIVDWLASRPRAG